MSRVWMLLFSLFCIGVVTACQGDAPAAPMAVETDLATERGLFPSASIGGGGGTMAYCDGSDCDGGGGNPFTVVESGPSRGYALGFTISQCKTLTVSGADADSDGMDDKCEHTIALNFTPRLHFSGFEELSARETYWLAHRKFSCGAYRATVGYGGQPIGECIEYVEVVRVMYLLGYYDDAEHNGDSEFLIVDVAFAPSDNSWRTSRVFMSAHWGTWADSSRWWYWHELEFPNTTIGGRPRVWVATGKHANYNTESHCDSGSLFSWDTCGPGWEEHVTAAPLLNIGESASRLINCVRSEGKLSVGEECFWTNPHFKGWYSTCTASCFTTGYKEHTADFMSSPNSQDYMVL